MKLPWKRNKHELHLSGLDKQQLRSQSWFLSHSYKDTEAVEALKKSLPRGTKLFIFPQITVSPNEMVSDNLIISILDHPGLIYLAEEQSAQSFWVTFERDYALRAGKIVAAYKASTHELCRDFSQPMRLPTSSHFADHHPLDTFRVRTIMSIMRTERYFDLWDYNTMPPHEGLFIEELPTPPVAAPRRDENEVS